jgi:cytochrome P450
MMHFPPGPRAPSFVQFWQWTYRPVEFMDTCALRFGDWFTVRLPGNRKFVFTSDPSAIKDVFSANPDHLSAAEFNNILKPLVGEKSLIVIDGADHSRMRTHAAQPFYSERMHSYGVVMQGMTNRAIQRWVAGPPFALHQEMQHLTLDIMMNAMFGSNAETRLAILREKLIEILLLTSSPARLFILGNNGDLPLPKIQRALGGFSPWGKVLKLLDHVDRILYDEIQARQQKPAEYTDILSMLMRSHEGREKSFDKKEIRDQIMTLLIAGHEITAGALAWIFCRLISHPDVMESLLGEVKAKSGCDGVDLRQIEHLPYLEAVIYETLRLNPVIPVVGRYLKKPMRLGGYDLPAGAFIVPCIYLIHRREDLWPDPKRFNPVRFIGRRWSPWEFFPFGGGADRCLGAAFAIYEMKIIIAQILHCVTLDGAPGYAVKAVRHGITLVPSEGMPVIVKKRWKS